MKYAFAVLAGLAAIAAAVPQGVTAEVPAPGSPVCNPTYSGSFELSVVNASTLVSRMAKRATGGALILTLSGGVLKDAEGRTGYIASNRQFQFDAPPQAGAIYTSGFSVCSNSTLALASAVFYECYSGGFYNLYDRPAESTCYPVFLDTIPTSGALAPSASVTQIGDGQPQASTAAVAPVTQLGDGQPQAPTMTTLAPITQITDGQIQAPTNATLPTPTPIPFNAAPGRGAQSFAAVVVGAVILGAAIL